MKKVPTPPEVPTLEKLQEVSAESNKIGQFLDWLIEEFDIDLPQGVEDLLYKYFDIDKDQAEVERRSLLAYQRYLNELDGAGKWKKKS